VGMAADLHCWSRLLSQAVSMQAALELWKAGSANGDLWNECIHMSW